MDLTNLIDETRMRTNAAIQKWREAIPEEERKRAAQWKQNFRMPDGELKLEIQYQLHKKIPAIRYLGECCGSRLRIQSTEVIDPKTIIDALAGMGIFNLTEADFNFEVRSNEYFSGQVIEDNIVYDRS